MTFLPLKALTLYSCRQIYCLSQLPVAGLCWVSFLWGFSLGSNRRQPGLEPDKGGLRRMFPLPVSLTCLTSLLGWTQCWALGQATFSLCPGELRMKLTGAASPWCAWWTPFMVLDSEASLLLACPWRSHRATLSCPFNRRGPIDTRT